MTKLRILIADDHELVRSGARAILRAQNGWRVVGEAGRRSLSLQGLGPLRLRQSGLVAIKHSGANYIGAQLARPRHLIVSRRNTCGLV
jgi:DNA-binding NarL/FixJ family response regulator